MEAARAYMECEYIHTALYCLSYMSYHVNFPLLYCDILPRLHDDLIKNDVSTLAEYVVRRSYQVHVSQGELEEIIFKRLCQNSAIKLKMQCGGEYFPDNDIQLRATRICALTVNA